MSDRRDLLTLIDAVRIEVEARQNDELARIRDEHGSDAGHLSRLWWELECLDRALRPCLSRAATIERLTYSEAPS